jgi:hypothetical protein
MLTRSTLIHLLMVFPLALSVAHAQTQIIPQVADGGAWQTTLVLTNTGTSTATASLTFFQSGANGTTSSWTPPFQETSSTQSLSLPAASTTFLHTLGTAANLTEGWAQLQASSSVVAYAIFTQTVLGRQNQDGTAPAAAAVSRVLEPFDNSNGFATTMAIANPGTASISISVAAQPTSGPAVQLSAISLPAGGYTAFSVPTQYLSTSGQRGLLEFSSTSGIFSIIALRFNPTGAFTASPVYAESGSPVIVPGASVFNGNYAGSFTSTQVSGAVSATVNNGVITVNSAGVTGGTGSGTVTASGQITFGVAVGEGVTCNFSGAIVLSGTGATASGTFNCPSQAVSGTWNITRQ